MGRLSETQQQVAATSGGRRSRRHQQRKYAALGQDDDDDDEAGGGRDRSLDHVRYSLLSQFMKWFLTTEAEAAGRKEAAAAAAKKRMAKAAKSAAGGGKTKRTSTSSSSYGFGAMLESLKGRNYNGYTRLEPEPLAPKGSQIILDPHSPITWNSKPYYVQRPATTDVLEDLANGDVITTEKNVVAGGGEGGDGGGGKHHRSGDSEDRGLEEQETEEGKEKEKAERLRRKFVGIFLAAVSGLFFTLCSVTVKLLPRIDPSEVLLFRALVQLVLTLPLLVFTRSNPLGPPGVRFVVYLQGVIGCLTVTCIFIGFARLPVGDAATIIFCSPIFVMVFSHVILHEHCGFYRVLVILMLFVGVVLIARPPFLEQLLMGQDNGNVNPQVQSSRYDVLGYGAALGGTLLTASNFVCMRKLREVHFSVLIFAFSVMSAVMSSAIVAGVAEFKLPRTTEEWVYSGLVGVFGLFGQCLLAVALRYETAGVVSVTRSMDIAVAYVIQIIWFEDIPVWTSILGAFVVILAVFTMAMEDAFLGFLEKTCGGHGWC